jgi:peptidoglycan/xylan/chitin deacetylase (PgdA/CDA1 family)
MDAICIMKLVLITIVLLVTLEIALFLPLVTVFGQIPYLTSSNRSFPLSSSENQNTLKASHHILSPLTETNAAATITDTRTTSGNTSILGSNTKVVIINFDDSYKSQYTYAKPILDKYGFKATFFEVCNWVGSGSGDNTKMTWQDIAELRNEGYDIEPHTMNHPDLKKLSSAELNFEIGQTKQCLLDHGINPATIFAYPYGEGSNSTAVVNTVSKYYDLARTDTTFPLTFLHCDIWKNSSSNQTDCRTYSDNGTLTFANRYSINGWSHRHIVGDYSANTRICKDSCYYYNNSQMLERFIANVNSQDNYNKYGIIRAIPIVIYHTFVTYPDVSYSQRPVDTTVNLFDAEMRYLHDNGFKVVTMANLTYDENSNYLYIDKKQDSRLPQ